VLHPFFDSPGYIQSDFPEVSDDTGVDVVFVDFIESDVIKLLNGAQSVKTYSTADVKTYSPLLTNGVFGVYVQRKWN
jgi:hypothetical protein